MKRFNDFVTDKSLDRLAEKCVRENIPIVEFVQWYEEEGQYLNESFWSDVGSNAAKGAGIGGLAAGVPTGGTGALAGAGIGGLAGGAYGAGKYLVNRLRGTANNSVATARQQAVAALERLKTLSGADNTAVLDKMLARIQRISPTAPVAGTPAPVAGTPAPVAGTPAPAGSLPVLPNSRIIRKHWPNFLDAATLTKYNPNVISVVNWGKIEPLYTYLNGKKPEAAQELLTYLINNNPNASKEAKAIYDRDSAAKAAAAKSTEAPISSPYDRDS